MGGGGEGRAVCRVTIHKMKHPKEFVLFLNMYRARQPFITFITSHSLKQVLMDDPFHILSRTDIPPQLPLWAINAIITEL